MGSQADVLALPFDEFRQAQAQWDELVAATRGATPFLTHPWLTAFWNHFGAGHGFSSLVVREEGRWLAAAPMALRRVRFAGRRLVVAEIAGTGPVPTRGMGLADRVDLLVRDDAPQARAALCAAVARLLQRADVIDLKALDAASPTVPALIEVAPRSARILRHSLSPCLPLGFEWADYLASRSQKFRKNLKRCARKLEELGPTAAARLGPGDDARLWMDEVLEVDAASWKARRGTNLFRDPALRAFFTDLVPRLHERGLIDLHVLRVAGRALAYELGFDFKNRIVAYNAAFDREHVEASPGTLVTAAVVRAACERARDEYDMGRGRDEYKVRWGGALRTQVEIVIPAHRPRARLYAAAGLALKTRLKGWHWLAELDDRLTGLRARWRST